MSTLGATAAKSGTSFLAMAGGIASSVYAIGALLPVLAGGATALYRISEAGADLDYTREKFDRLSKSMGTTGDVMLNELRQATKGTLSDFQLTQQGTDLFQLGLAKTTEEAVRLSSVMTALGMDTGELTLALANQSKRRLDQLGLSLTEFNKNEAIFKSKGLSKEDAFTQAFLVTAEQTVEKVGNKADSSAGSFDRLGASWENVKNSFKVGFADMFTPFNNMMSEYLNDKAKGMEQAKSYEEYLKALDGNPVSMSIPEWENRQKGYSASAARYTGMAGLYGGGSAQAAEAAPDYGNLLKVSRALTDVTGNYNDKLNQLAEKLIDAPKKYGATAEQAENLKKSLTGLDSMTDGYNSTLMQELQILTQAEAAYGANDARVRELREGINRLKEDAVSANNEMLLGTMANAGATDEQQLNFARAAGMISEQAFQQSMALTKISDAYLSNKLTGDQAAAAARGVVNGLSSINGFNAVAYVDVFIRQHGSISVGGKSYSANSAGGILMSESTGARKSEGNASGGPVGANEISGITEYGEPEIYTSGGKQYLVSGKRGGYVSPLNAQAGGGGWQQMYALVSRIPSAEENARALVKAMRAA